MGTLIDLLFALHCFVVFYLRELKTSPAILMVGDWPKLGKGGGSSAGFFFLIFLVHLRNMNTWAGI